MSWQKYKLNLKKLTSFGGNFLIMEKFERLVSPIIDQTLGFAQLISIGKII